jgi:cation:H+ antiporter
MDAGPPGRLPVDDQRADAQRCDGAGDGAADGGGAVTAPRSWERDLLTAGACAAGGVLVKLASPVLPLPLTIVGLGIGLIAASFLLAWAADAGDAVFSGGVVLAIIALLTVLPEFVIEARFAYTLQAELVTANLTGATRLLLTGAVGLPLALGFIARGRGRGAPLRLAPPRRLELAILLITSIFAIQIVAQGHLSLLDGVILVALYFFYVRRVQGSPDEEPAVLGVPAGLLSLRPAHRRPAIVGLIVAAGAIVVTIANPFADALLAGGAAVGIDPYFLIQSVVPVATESPEFVVVAVLVANRRPAQGLALFLASSVSQWTLASGVLPIAYFAGGGGTAMPLDGHQQLELGFTIALTLFAVAALASLRPERVDAGLMIGLVALQLVFPTPLTQLAAAFVFVVFALDLLASRRRAVGSLLRALRGEAVRRAP